MLEDINNLNKIIKSLVTFILWEWYFNIFKTFVIELLLFNVTHGASIVCKENFYYMVRYMMSSYAISWFPIHMDVAFKDQFILYSRQEPCSPTSWHLLVSKEDI